MAERKPRTRSTRAKPPAEESKAQAEFARYKERVQPEADAAGQAASFASPLPRGAMPAWSLQPSLVAAEPPGAWGRSSPGTGGSPSIVSGVGTTIRLGVDVLNAALSNSLLALSGVGEAVGAVAWPGASASCGCDTCCECCGPSAYDCCCVMGCSCGTCGCCEPSVGTCC